jgi:hypothetical protein
MLWRIRWWTRSRNDYPQTVCIWPDMHVYGGAVSCSVAQPCVDTTVAQLSCSVVRQTLGVFAAVSTGFLGVLGSLVVLVGFLCWCRGGGVLGS